jgi:hypothetical protein
MLRTILALILLLAMSCAHKTAAVRNKLSDRIEQEEVRSLQQIKDDMQVVLAEHGEIDAQAKEEISVRLTEGLDRLQELKDRESQVIQAVLNKMLLSTSEGSAAEFAGLNSEIEELYRAKAKNVSQLIKEIRAATGRNRPTDTFYRDLGLIIREIR